MSQNPAGAFERLKFDPSCPRAWKSTGELVIGFTDCANSKPILISIHQREISTWLGLLDGSRNLEDLLLTGSAMGLSHTQLRELITELVSAGHVYSVENVPLQSWFAVSITCFQRNTDIYINGRLVKSCVLPGVPKPAVGDIILADNGGFSGSVCNLHWYNSMISPDDAKTFHGKGTQCATPAAAGTPAPVDKDSVFVTLFGYTFRFATLDKGGKELSSFTF
jgi:hypothetical protein